ncbi:PREDICTED: zinc finger and BTB domain-containing protein 17-like [Vollenhovia emeryi]|uniref:zinc finger and BTB domain-containing protein 17-like n=1 Tax=Vollenhovia emeryi TaxID=411798 RepID=UPI0005F37AE6|nr:PREDICTED: zinc finger and BTB domain-containing protein 17-like [Vollenhovia emeryi]XP_011876377.1 PREDICTED: zinc finger and BTB domain-containing protein 17-like [Vollenhovia emeryi]
MSCRGAAAAAAVATCTSRRHSCERISCEGEGAECAPANALFASPRTEEVGKRDRRPRRNETWHQTTAGKGVDVVETVADFEKWLKMRSTEPPVPTSMDLDAAKMVEGVDRYLGEEVLSHSCFLSKDPYGLSIDIDLADAKKLNLSSSYDPILQDLAHGENRLLEPPCEKVVDEFMLPEFQLDHLDPLAALAPDDMMVAGEILPSASSQPTLNVENQDVAQSVPKTGIPARSVETPCEKSALGRLPSLVANEMGDAKAEQETVAQSSAASSELFTEALSPMDESSPSTVTSPMEVGAATEQSKKTKLEPRIIKKRRQMTERLEKKLDKRINGKSFAPADADTRDGTMAVVAISTDKISNMTQIVINTGTEKQIYQGKTSELIEATGNFPKLPKIDTTAAVWNGGAADYAADSNPSSQYEIVISNALEELGITDDSLQPLCATEHDKVWLCPRDDCNRQFGRLYTLKGHLLAHYGVRPFKCDFEGCTWAFYSEFKLKRHKETHLKRKDYVCEVEGCNRRFTTVYNLWSHTKLHSRPNRIVCQVPDCGEKFQTKRALEVHMKSHDQRHAPYVCQHEGCGKRYYSSNALTSHQRSHSYKEVDIKCSWPGCGKIFDKPCRLKAHMRSHTGYKPYPCTFQDCNWAFSSSSKLKRHQKKHTNERKFVCDVPDCGKAFMRSEHLKEHRLTHTEGRFFQCFVCAARFSAKSSLYVHIKKHQQSKPDDLNVPESACNDQKRARTRESHYSRVKPIKPKRWNTELASAAETIAKENDVEKQNADVCSQDENQMEWLYRCPIDVCGHLFSSETSLREHMLKAHGIHCDDLLTKSSSDDADIDYVLYTVHSSPPSSPNAVEEEQMVMVTPCEAVILDTSSSRTDHGLPEAEPSPPPPPPPSNTSLKSSETFRNDARTGKETVSAKEQGSARTDVTYSDWSKLKNSASMSSVVTEVSDVVLGASGDLSEGLLFTELPSMYYQDDVAGTEYQVLLLDSSPLESASNLRGLE